MNDTASKTSAGTRRIRLFVFMVVVGGVIGAFVYRPRGAGEPQPKGDSIAVAEPAAPQLMADEVKQAIELKDVSIGQLENGPAAIQVNGKNVSGIDVAADGFAQLAVKLPKERLPVQNLAIARLLLLKVAQEENVATRRMQACEAAAPAGFRRRLGSRSLDRGDRRTNS